jgi:hypothetical protein
VARWVFNAIFRNQRTEEYLILTVAPSNFNIEEVSKEEIQFFGRGECINCVFPE